MHMNTPLSSSNNGVCCNRVYLMVCLGIVYFQTLKLLVDTDSEGLEYLIILFYSLIYSSHGNTFCLNLGIG